MKKNIIKITTILFIILTINVLFNINFSLAANQSQINLSDWGGNDSTGSEKITSTLGMALYVVQVVAVGTATIMLIALGIKYMVSSVSERAEIKKHLVIYVLGAVLMFGASGIVKLIQNFAIDNI